MRSRTTHCQQLKYDFTAGSRTPSPVPDSFCPAGTRPTAQEPCYAPPCLRAEVKVDRSRYVQLQPRKKLRLKAGGHARLIEGTEVRARCNARNYDRTHITWSLQGTQLPRRGRVKVSRSGVLQLRRLLLSDSGVYVCHVGDVSVPLNIDVVTHKEARDARIRREEMETRDAQFLAKFRRVIKKRKNRREEYTERFILKHFSRAELPLGLVNFFIYFFKCAIKNPFGAFLGLVNCFFILSKLDFNYSF